MFLIHFSEHRFLTIYTEVNYQEMKKNAVFLKTEIIFIVFMHTIYLLKELIENVIKNEFFSDISSLL